MNTGSPLRITIILPDAAPSPVGGFKVQYLYARELARRGHRVTVVHVQNLLPLAFTRSALKDWYHHLRVRYYWLFLHWRKYFRGELELASWFPGERGFDLKLAFLPHPLLWPSADVTVYTAWQTVRFGPINWRRLGAKAQVVYDYEIWSTADQALKNRMRSAFCLPGVHRISTSYAVKSMLDEAGTDTFAHCPCGLELEHFYQTGTLEERGEVVGFPIRQGYSKGMAYMQEAVKELKRLRPGIRVRAFGSFEPAHWPGVEAWVQPSMDELREFYNGCAVFVLPSLAEGFGLPALESMACGAALVTTDNGGVQDFADDGVTARVVPPADAQAIVTAVLELLDDPKQRLQLARAGQQKAQEFDWGKATDRLEGILYSAVAGKL